VRRCLRQSRKFYSDCDVEVLYKMPETARG
jgi:hypothetical protein